MAVANRAGRAGKSVTGTAFPRSCTLTNASSGPTARTAAIGSMLQPGSGAGNANVPAEKISRGSFRCGVCVRAANRQPAGSAPETP